MDLGITGKTAVVTGATAGLGLAIARAFAAEGVNLALFARTDSKLQALAAELGDKHGIKVVTTAGDMKNQADVNRLAEASEFAGGPDILCLNTGRPPYPMREVLDETDDERWELAYRTQLWGGIMILRAITPKLVAKGWGRVVAVTSATVKAPLPVHGLSTVFRAGIAGYLKHLSMEIGYKGVTVNAVAPVSVATESLVRDYDPVKRAAATPLKRLGKPEELAATVVFLSSVPAGYINGTTIQLDGGQTTSLT